MKKNNLLSWLFIIACFFICFSCGVHHNNEISVFTTVSFGHPAPGQGPCTGKGICDKHSGTACGLHTQVIFDTDANNNITSLTFIVNNVPPSETCNCVKCVVSPDTIGQRNTYTFDTVKKVEDTLYLCLPQPVDTLIFSFPRAIIFHMALVETKDTAILTYTGCGIKFAHQQRVRK